MEAVLMKLVYSAICGIVALTATGFAQQGSEQAIRKAVTVFMESGDQRDVRLAELVLHDDFQLLYIAKEGLMKSGKEEYKGLLKKGGIGGESRTVSFKSVTVSNDIAGVHAVFESDKAVFDQYINLVQEEGVWKIVNIVLDFGMK